MAVCTSKSLKRIALSGLTSAALSASLVPLAQVATQSPAQVFAQPPCDSEPCPPDVLPVPEPSTLLLVAPAAGYLVAKIRSRRAKP